MKVALTIDAEHPDRPRCDPGVPAGMVDLLREKGVRATFFLQGRWVEAYPATARRISGDGHLIGNHSFYHARMPLLSDEGLAADVAAAERAILDVTGSDPRPRFRCPFGAGRDDPRIAELLRRTGYRHIGYDVVVEDWEPDATPEAIVETAVRGALSRDWQAVILLHAWPEPTLEALPTLIDRLTAEGATLVALDELP
jgi:peptidoglycan/xylan/chitin deacetylase (PgdA/CDA1 family)